MQIIEQLDKTLVKQLHQLFKNEWWTNTRSLSETQRCVEHSTFTFAAVEGDVLLGFVRVVSDLCFKAFIFDLIICPSQRNTGLGKTLLDHVLVHTELRQVKHTELYCLPELTGYYENLGFSSDVAGVVLMRKNNA